MSFQKYVPLLTRQNATNMAIDCDQRATLGEHVRRARGGEHEQVLDPLLRPRLAEQGTPRHATTAGTTASGASVTHTGNGAMASIATSPALSP